MSPPAPLYNPTRHTPLSGSSWDPDRARSTIVEILEWTLAGRRPEGGWPSHPDEDGPPKESFASFYSGAVGVLWALERLQGYLDQDLPLDLAEEAERADRSYQARPDTDEVVPSLFLGVVGILLVRRHFRSDAAVDARLFEAIEANIQNPTLESLWGAPGTMLAAAFLAEETGAADWIDLYRRNANHLFDTWQRRESEPCAYWTQDLYGKQSAYLGAGHGFFGNTLPLFRGVSWLSSDQQKLLVERTQQVLRTMARHEAEASNWPAGFDEKGQGVLLMQWCHGAPGVITSCSSIPIDAHPEIEEALRRGGEAVWQAGALSKGIGLCHGTDGNALAFLELYRRTQDPLWLERARAFAAHALGQRNGRYSVYTGELGLAWVLHLCLEGRAGMPLLDGMMLPA